MKKALLYLCIVTYLFSFSETRQLVYVPNLLQHISQHIENGTMEKESWLSLIAQHYLYEHANDSSHQNLKLPFKTVQKSICVHFFPSPPSLEVQWETSSRTFQEIVRFPERSVSTGFIELLYHPPQMRS